jgi:sec-independent protein translocase protein TatA
MISYVPVLGFFGGIGGWEIIAIALVALLIFGRRLPEIMRGLGTGVRQFKRGIEGDYDDESKKIEDQRPQAPEIGHQEPAHPAEGSVRDAVGERADGEVRKAEDHP